MHNSFNDWRKPHMARGDFSIGGIAVVVSPNLPREHIADEIVPIYWPRPICWFLKQPRRYVAGAKIERDQAFMIAGKLFIPPTMSSEIYRIDFENISKGA